MELEPHGIDRYILDKRSAVRCPDLVKWHKWMQDAQRMVRHTELASGGNSVHVCTTFLGIDVNFDADDPVLFETMVLGGAHDRQLYRYRSWAEAEHGHEAVVLHCKLGYELVDAARLRTWRELATTTLAKAGNRSVSEMVEDTFQG